MPGKIVNQEEWLVARKGLLEKEKELVRASDKLAAERQSLPMVEVTEPYCFQDAASDGTATTKTLSDLFDGKDQLLVYHFMFGPDDSAGCHGCSFLADHLPDVRHLHSKNTNLVLVSRAPPERLAGWRARFGKDAWSLPWYSSAGSDFNYDFHATFDEDKRPIEGNYMGKEELVAKGQLWNEKGERSGMSVFLKTADGRIFHTYSTYARGLDKILGTLQLLDLTPLGRRDDKMGPAAYKYLYEYGENEDE